MSNFELINKSTVSDNKLIKIIEFVKSPRLAPCKMVIKNSKNHAYDAGFYFGLYNEPYIIARFASHKAFPFKFQFRSDKSARKGYYDGVYDFPTKTHCLVYTLAHELRHWYQYNHPKKRFWLYTNPQRLAENDADAYALKKLDEFNLLREEGIDIFKD